MREIKFRAWDKNNGMTDWSALRKLHCNTFLNQSYNVVMQYTGLKDKDGVEIYEGDIVKNGTEKMVVVWQQEDAGFWLEFDGGNQSVGMHYSIGYKVVGNIYENPEVLK